MGRNYLYFLPFFFLVIVYHYVNKLTIENKLYNYQNNNSKVTIILALGDSLTEGLHDWPRSKKFHPYTDKLKELLTTQKYVKVINKGVSGERAPGMKRRLDVIVQNQTLQNCLVLILAGTNDYIDLIKQSWHVVNKTSYLSSKVTQIYNDIQTLHTVCHKHNASTGVISIPEIKLERKEKFKMYQYYRSQINARLKKFANRTQTKTVFIDLSLYLSKLTSIPEVEQLMWDDGVHLTPYGYDKMAEIIYDRAKDFIYKFATLRLTISPSYV